MKTTQEDVRLVLTKIKQLLKQKKIKYRELASALSLSEASVKRLFTSVDISFGRLNQICSALGVSLNEVLTSIEDERVRDVSFPAQVEDLLSKSPIHLSLYWKVAIERMTLSSAIAELKIDKAKGFSVAKDLDKMGLIELHAGDRIIPPQLAPVRWAKLQSKLQDVICLQWGRKVVEDAYYKKKADFDLTVQYYQLCADQLNRLKNRLAELEDEFAKQTIHDMKFYPDQLISTRYVRAMADGSFVK